MISILHLSDLHIVQSGQWPNLRPCILKEAEKVRSKPREEKLLVLTGDFRNSDDTDYTEAQAFLTELFDKMDIDPATGVFVVPGNDDVGNEVLMNKHFPGDRRWKRRQLSSVNYLKTNDSSNEYYSGYIEDRMESYRPFCEFLEKLGIPNADGAAAPHVRQWPASGKPKLNLFHLNTTLVADGGKEKDHQRVDLLTATNDQLWKDADNSLPALALGHNSFFDLDKDHQTALEAVFRRHNVCAYLCGDTHKEELDRDRQRIHLTSGYSDGPTIPNIVGVKGAADNSDDYSDFGLYWHEWDEEAGTVRLRLLSWKPKVEQAAFLPGREDDYFMPRRDGAKAAASAEQNAKKPTPAVKQSEDGFNAQGNNQNSTSEAEPDVEDYTKDYRKQWTKNLFLNRRQSFFDTVAEVSLRDVYTDCRYSIWNSRTNEEHESKDAKVLRESLSENGGHLVLGDPGIGKSTLISWYLNSIDEASSRKVLVYRLSKFTLNMTDFHPDRTLLKQMGKTRDKLKGCVLFLDGLDECGLAPDERAHLLNSLQNSWSDCFSWVITCRRHYIPDNDLRDLTQIQRITLLPMESDEIEVFFKKYHNAARKTIDENGEKKLAALKSNEHSGIFSIPLILYMTVALDGIRVTENATVVSVYDQLFPKLLNRAYDMPSRVLLTEKQRCAIQTMDRHIALWMLHNDPDQAVIPKNVYKRIEQSIGGQVQEYHLHNYHSFMKHTEGDSERCYVHRTMYEYFVADGFVAAALEAKNAEALSGVIAWYWHKAQMSPTIQNYIRDKLKKPENKALCSLSYWEEAGRHLIIKGVKGCPQPSTAVVPGCPFPAYPKTLAKDREQENTAFYSLCRLLNGVRVAAGENRKIYESATLKMLAALASAIRNCGADRFEVFFPNFWLQGQDLRRAHLRGADLTHADLTGSHLDSAHLDSADLYGAHFTHANLTRADLTGATLVGAHLTSARLTDAHLEGADLTDAHLERTDLTHAHLYNEHLDGAHLERPYLVTTNLDNSFHLNQSNNGMDLSITPLSFKRILSFDSLRKSFFRSFNLTTVWENVYLDDALLTDEQVKDIGERALASCTFSLIYVGQRRDIAKKYLRNDFFNEFFPKAAPNPPSNSK